MIFVCERDCYDQIRIILIQKNKLQTNRCRKMVQVEDKELRLIVAYFPSKDQIMISNARARKHTKVDIIQYMKHRMDDVNKRFTFSTSQYIVFFNLHCIENVLIFYT